MGQGFGLERALWFADGPAEAHEEPTFGCSRSRNYVACEVQAVQTAFGGIKIANFAKHEFRGVGARAIWNICLPVKSWSRGGLCLPRC